MFGLVRFVIANLSTRRSPILRIPWRVRSSQWLGSSWLLQIGDIAYQWKTFCPAPINLYQFTYLQHSTSCIQSYYITALSQLFTGHVQLWKVNAWRNDALEVPGVYSKLRVWRNTTIASMQPHQKAVLLKGYLGGIWNESLLHVAPWMQLSKKCHILKHHDCLRPLLW